MVSLDFHLPARSFTRYKDALVPRCFSNNSLPLFLFPSPLPPSLHRPLVPQATPSSIYSPARPPSSHKTDTTQPVRKNTTKRRKIIAWVVLRVFPALIWSSGLPGQLDVPWGNTEKPSERLPGPVSAAEQSWPPRAARMGRIYGRGSKYGGYGGHATFFHGNYGLRRYFSTHERMWPP
jgi:hypothetical protein